MAQGSSRLARAPGRGGRPNKRHASKMRKGSMFNQAFLLTNRFSMFNRKPKKQSLAAAHNKSKKLTAAIGRNIERTTGRRLAQNGGDLSTLKRVATASKNGGDESSKIAAAPKFNTRKQFRLTS